MGFIGARVNVRGVVQGVGFRYWTLKRARNYGLAGYVANLPNGSVEIKAEGERGMIEEFLKEVKAGPTYSDVTDIRVEWYEKPQGFEDFIIRHGDY